MNTSVEEFLANFSPQVREISFSLRNLVYKLVPDAEEIVYTGWGNIQYYFSGKSKSRFCAINPYLDRVDFFFLRATDLIDPAGLLEGTGKKLRHVKIKSLSQVNNQALSELILAAALLARSEK
ncbi:MAG TPA: DUF1801 domain-containing protein [Anaerolineaceae bacterium]|nr:DUF1801 domain-containing protein [Anaerolineaceae bacterium]